MVGRLYVLALSIGTIGALSSLTGCAVGSGDAARTRWSGVQSQRYPAKPRGGAAAVEHGAVTSLDSLISLAEASNPGLRGAFDRWTSAVEQVPQAATLPDPRITYGYFLESVETRVGPQRQRFGFSQTFPLFGKLGIRGDMAANAADAAGASFEAARFDLRFRLTQLWNDYYYLSRAIAVTEENVHLVTYLESVALTQYTAGRLSHSAVIRAQVELGRLEDRLRTLRDRRTPLLASLNAEVNRPADAPIPWPDSIDTRPVPLSIEELRETLLGRNPRLAMLRFMAEKASASTALAGRSPLPDLTLGAEYIDTDEARFPNVMDSGKDAAVATATINIPLWFGRYRAEKAQARAQESAAENDLTQLQNQLLADLEHAHYEYRDSERRVDLYAFTLLPRARQSLEVTEDSFTTGGADFLDLIDAQRTLLEFELAYERALVDRATMRAKLEQIVGMVMGSHEASGR